jgi:hypothetical protein
LFDTQREALEKAKQVDATVQQNTEAQKKQIEDQSQ